jgi:outer membrane biosynthesis protein TonB
VTSSDQPPPQPEPPPQTQQEPPRQTQQPPPPQPPPPEARPQPSRVEDALLEPLLAGLPPEEAAHALAQLINRASARLHALSRAEASARKEQPDWPQWAQLQNAARALVLQASTCRDLASRLASRRPPSS